ncbi:hypothetical protein M011DRAFT_158837 [Sporormia fimetaria CBS 119925]|uniref:Uncharacterized protein n=1 Tax=Sporormia fimetaria CBS 119925 TaxID=1340428 RepID=A0A6A6V4L1_9PLEO|nr:hypothetical protein M011DRAFT_158837 [Sporormia fimetaria CBS 119925]
MRQNDPNTGEVTWVPPPEGVKVLNHHLENAEEILRSHGNYCKACWILSRDMPVLGHRSKVDPQKLTIIQWAFDLAEMVDGAESGCQFCALFSVRYFADAGFRSFDWGGSSRLKISCCSMSPRADSAESNRLIKDALEKLRKVLADNPEANFTFVVEPLDYRSSDSSFCRVRFSPVRTLGMKPETFKRMVTFLDLELEIYATKKLETALPPRMSKGVHSTHVQPPARE